MRSPFMLRKTAERDKQCALNALQDHHFSRWQAWRSKERELADACDAWQAKAESADRQREQINNQLEETQIKLNACRNRMKSLAEFSEPRRRAGR